MGFDKLTNWHRWNGHACLWLILAHTFLSIWGYQLTDNAFLIGDGPKTSYWDETALIIWGGVYPGMIVATIGTGLLCLVAFSSYVFVRKRVSYELWYALHITAYAGIALGWFHQIPTGNDLIHITLAEWYWRSLIILTLVLLAWRIAVPFINAFRHRLRISEVTQEGPGVISLHIAGRRLDKIRAKPGQFFSWRFLTKGFWWAPLPFSLSSAPDGKSFRITIKNLGTHSARMSHLTPGTRVVAEGPFGVFTEASRSQEKVLLVAGGIGITPIRALIEEMEGDIIVLYRVMAERRPHLQRRARAARRRPRDHAAQRGRRPHDARGTRASLTGPFEGTRPRFGRTRGIPVWSHCVSRRTPERAPPCGRLATTFARGALRALTERRTVPRKTIVTLASIWILAYPTLGAWGAVQAPKTRSRKRRASP